MKSWVFCYLLFSACAFGAPLKLAVYPKVEIKEKVKVVGLTTDDAAGYWQPELRQKQLAVLLQKRLDETGVKIGEMTLTTFRKRLGQDSRFVSSSQAGLTARLQVDWYAVESPPDSAVVLFGMIGQAMAGEPKKVRVTMKVTARLIDAAGKTVYESSGKADIHNPKVPARTFADYFKTRNALQEDFQRSTTYAVDQLFLRLKLNN